MIFTDAWLDVRGQLLLRRLIGWREVEEGPVASPYCLLSPPHQNQPAPLLFAQTICHHTAPCIKSTLSPQVSRTDQEISWCHFFVLGKYTPSWAGLFAENTQNARCNLPKLCFWKSSLCASSCNAVFEIKEKAPTIIAISVQLLPPIADPDLHWLGQSWWHI